MSCELCKNDGTVSLQGLAAAVVVIVLRRLSSFKLATMDCFGVILRVATALDSRTAQGLSQSPESRLQRRQRTADRSVRVERTSAELVMACLFF